MIQESKLTRFYIFGYTQKEDLIEILRTHGFDLIEKINRKLFLNRNIDYFDIEYRGSPLRPGRSPKGILLEIQRDSSITFEFRGDHNTN